MKKTDTIANLAAALSAAQAELPAAEFDSVNPFLKNRYASLGSIIKASRPVLAKHGLAVTQLPVSGDNTIGVVTVLIHSSGEWMESELHMALDDEKGKSRAQVAGSIITYLRRYALSAVLNMYADEDTEANHVEQKPVKQEVKQEAKPQVYAPPETALMTLETALNVTNSDGMFYGQLDNDKLSNMSIGIAKALKKQDLTPEKRSEYELKRDAFKVILAARADAGS